jgi:hypothetical protein
MEKAKNDAYLSEEEREKLNEETAPLIKYTFFNGFMIFLFNFCAFVHPAHFDRTNS